MGPYETHFATLMLTEPIPIPKMTFMEDSDGEDLKNGLSPSRSVESSKRVTFASLNTVHTFEPTEDEDQEIIIVLKNTSMESMRRKWTKSVNNVTRFFSKSL
jgi:hypothetical protein